MEVMISRADGADADSDWVVMNAVIERIYDCALQPSLWDDTLYQIISCFCPIGWQGAFLIWEGHVPPRAQFVASAGLTAGVPEVYAAVYAGRNPLSERLRSLPNGNIIDTSALMTPDEFKNSSLSRDFLGPWGIDRVVGVLLDWRADERLSLLFPGPSDRDVTRLKRALSVLSPHLQRATRISHRLASLEITSRAAVLATEQAPYAIVTLDRDLNILTANQRSNMSVQSGAITISANRFAFTHKPSQQRLVHWLERRPPKGLAFQITDAQGNTIPVLAAHIEPQSAQMIGHELSGTELILTIGSAPDETPFIEINSLMAWFGLTPTEARLAVALSTGMSLKDYAAQRAVSLNAVRFSLKNIFRKTATRSQAQLVATLAQLPRQS